MTTKEVLQELKNYGNESTKKIFTNHGAKEPFFGVKVADLKKILKKTKKNHELSLELFATKNADAMYLAGLMADENKITKTQLRKWANDASWYMVGEYAVAWVASESKFAVELGLEWIDSKKEHIAAIGWATLASHAAVTDDENLDIKMYDQLLDRIGEGIHEAPNRARYTMNGFVIAIGTYIESLNKKASQVAEKIGKVQVNVGDTACKVPLATTYIQKVVDKGRVGKKRKTARC